MKVPVIFRLQESGVLEARHSDDGTEVHFVLPADNGPIGLTSTPERLLEIAGKMSQLAAHALSLSRHQVITAVELSAASAQTPVGADSVALSLRSKNGSLQHFGMTPELIEKLRKDMEAAEHDAIANRAQTLQ